MLKKGAIVVVWQKVYGQLLGKLMKTLKNLISKDEWFQFYMYAQV